MRKSIEMLNNNNDNNNEKIKCELIKYLTKIDQTIQSKINECKQCMIHERQQQIKQQQQQTDIVMNDKSVVKVSKSKAINEKEKNKSNVSKEIAKKPIDELEQKDDIIPNENVEMMRIISEIRKNQIQNDIHTLTESNTFTVNTHEMITFGKINPGKKFKIFNEKIQSELYLFEFNVYITPNGYQHKNNNFVYFVITLNGFPLGISSAVMHFKLYEKQTKTEYRCTKIFENKTDIFSYVSLTQTSLPWKKCEKYKELVFGYEIEILKINTNNSGILHHSTCAGQSLFDFSDTLPIAKYMLSALRFSNYLTLFYSKTWRDAYCISLGCMGKQEIINISLHLFKLPPKVVKMEIKLGIRAFQRYNKDIYYKRKHIFSYNSTNLIIKLTKRESEMVRSYATQNYKKNSNHLSFIFCLTILRIWIEGFMNEPCDRSKMNNEIRREISQKQSDQNQTEMIRYMQQEMRTNNEKQKTKLNRICIVCNKTNKELQGNMKICGHCKQVQYCSKHCQKIDWVENFHRLVCDVD
eukprot:147907_1